MPYLLEDKPEAYGVGEGDRLSRVNQTAVGEYAQRGRGGTNGVDEAPVFDLERTTDFAVAIERVRTGVAGDVNVVGMAG